MRDDRKELVFGGISHDLRSPLNSVSGILNLLNNHGDNFTKEEVIDLTRKLDKSVGDFSNLLNNLLQWATTQMGKVKYDPKELDLEAVIAENVNLMLSNAERKDIDLQYEIEDDLFLVADKNMFNFILRNLISNAIKFTEHGGKIWVKAVATGKQVAIYVKDNGVGISKENLSKLFNLESHFSTKGTDKETGTGLGLMLCKEFVHKCHGEIEVNSAEGQGTEFSIYFTAAVPEKNI